MSEPTPKQAEALRLLRETELMAIEIADQLGCTPGNITHLTRKATGMTPSQYRCSLGWVGCSRPVSPRLAEAFSRRYADGATIEEVAREFGVGTRAVRRAIDDVRPSGGRRIELPEAEIVRRYEGGESCPKLAAAYGVSDRHIRRILSRRNVPRRRLGRPPTKAQEAQGV